MLLRPIYTWLLLHIIMHACFEFMSSITNGPYMQSLRYTDICRFLPKKYQLKRIKIHSFCIRNRQMPEFNPNQFFTRTIITNNTASLKHRPKHGRYIACRNRLIYSLSPSLPSFHTSQNALFSLFELTVDDKQVDGLAFQDSEVLTLIVSP